MKWNSRILEQVRSAAQTEQPPEAPLGPRNPTDPVPATSSQEALWILQQTQLGHHYNDFFDIRIQGAIDVLRMQHALQTVVDRHEALRAVFRVEEGRLHQAIQSAVPVVLDSRDLCGVEKSRRQELAMKLALSQGAEPFDLESGPLFRATLIRVETREWWLLLTFHHLVMDGWSRTILLRDLVEAYSTGTVAEPVLIQYGDYAVWQARQMESAPLEREKAYWSSRLKGPLPRLDLPIDFARPARRTFQGNAESFEISAADSAQVKEVCRSTGATPFSFFLAVFKILLWRYSGQTDLIVGTPFAGRDRSEVESIVGYFLNTLPLRSTINPAASFRSCLQEIQNAALDAISNARLPFTWMVRELSPDRDPARNPFFDVLFIYQTPPAPIDSSDGAQWSPMELDHETAKFDLTLQVWESAETFRVQIEFSSELFERATIGRLARHFSNAVARLGARPDGRLEDLDVSDPAELERLLSWGRGPAQEIPCVSVPELIARKAILEPERPAVICGSRTLTYAEIDRSSQALAGEILRAARGSGRRVAVAMNRSPELVIALLAVWKSGNAYVPLDPEFPEERLRMMLEDSDPALILTSPDLSARFSAWGKTLEIPEGQAWLEVPETLPPPDPNGTAYVIYTSGSTGRPKGVVIPMRALVNSLLSFAVRPGCDADDRLVAGTTISFDIAALEIFLPLICGARVILARREDTSDGASLAQLLQRHAATIVQATPSGWRLLLDSGWEGLDGLKAFCGGEALPYDLAEKLFERCLEVWNLYGPTETTIWSSVDQIEHPSAIALGKPVANTRLFVLDRSDRPAPIGIAGELWIGGDSLATGYLNQPELTDAKFREVRVGSETLRLYRTGDQARWTENGKLLYLGRLDQQVKIRGHRIELGDIESALRRLSGVSDAAAAASAAGDLVAYLVAPGGALSTAELRSKLLTMVPSYMAPARFVFLEKLPRTPNGKLDRSALPAPSPVLRGNEVPEEPQSEWESRLVGVWKEVLQVERVGLEQNFFDLGGHSLLLARVQGLLHDRFSAKVPIVSLFQFPTIRTLAHHLHAGASPVPQRAALEERAAQKRRASERRKAGRKEVNL